MYNGEMNEKIKLLYKLHIPPGKKSERKVITQFPKKNLLLLGKSCLMQNPILLPSSLEHRGYVFVVTLTAFYTLLITNGTFLGEMYKLQCQSSHICCIQRSFAANYMVTYRQNTN